MVAVFYIYYKTTEAYLIYIQYTCPSYNKSHSSNANRRCFLSQFDVDKAKKCLYWISTRFN